MKFVAREGALPELELLEFRGEFVRAEQVEMALEGDTVHFRASYIKGAQSATGRHLVFRRKGGGLELVGVAASKRAFLGAPRYRT